MTYHCDTCNGTGSVDTGIGPMTCDGCAGAGIRIGHCKDCRHFDKYDSTCNGLDRFTSLSKAPPGDMALVVDADDDQGLTGYLLVDPMFGCIKFTRKGISR